MKASSTQRLNRERLSFSSLAQHKLYADPAACSYQVRYCLASMNQSRSKQEWRNIRPHDFLRGIPFPSTPKHSLIPWLPFLTEALALSKGRNFVATSLSTEPTYQMTNTHFPCRRYTRVSNGLFYLVPRQMWHHFLHEFCNIRVLSLIQFVKKEMAMWKKVCCWRKTTVPVFCSYTTGAIYWTLTLPHTHLNYADSSSSLLLPPPLSFCRYCLAATALCELWKRLGCQVKDKIHRDAIVSQSLLANNGEYSRDCGTFNARGCWTQEAGL